MRTERWNYEASSGNFLKGEAPGDYYRYICREGITKDELFAAHRKAATDARKEAWLCTLHKSKAAEIDTRIRDALNGCADWILIGGPPCQAYSIAGRNRMRGPNPAKFEKDHRHFLYKEYLRIIAKHRPAIFVMENVKGLLSSRVSGRMIFPQILADLEHPDARWREVFPRIRYAARSSFPAGKHPIS